MQTEPDPLCERLATDVDEAFPELVVAHQDLVFGVALRVMRDDHCGRGCRPGCVRARLSRAQALSADAVRELRLRPWLARIALNAARNEIRGRKRARRRWTTRRRALPVDGRRAAPARRTQRRAAHVGAAAGRPAGSLPARRRAALRRRPFVSGAGRDARPAAGQRQIGRPSRDRAAARRVRRRTARAGARGRQFHDDSRAADGRRCGRGRPTHRERPAPAAQACAGRLGTSGPRERGSRDNDEYVQVDGPIGPLFVAYGRRGISLVERVDAVGDAGRFRGGSSARLSAGRCAARSSAPALVQRIIDARLWGHAGEPAAR